MGPGTKTYWPTDRRSQCEIELAPLHCKLQTHPLVREGTLHEK
jgi:hypothetical protein